MAYDLQPGKFSIFPNDKKEKDTQPDWKGSIKLPDGQEYYFDAWNNIAKNSGKPYIQGKIGNPKNSNGAAVNQPASYNAFPSAVPAAADEDIPF
jgi:uncharacterized protein (DUF736 family)